MKKRDLTVKGELVFNSLNLKYFHEIEFLHTLTKINITQLAQFLYRTGEIILQQFTS